MRYVPRPYQVPTIDFILATPRCNVWQDPGLGKTVSALTALDYLTLVEDPFPALVIGPKRVARRVWSAEAAKWDHLRHLRVSRIVGTAAQRASARKSVADICTINYENVPELVNHFGRGASWPFRTVIADECSRLKGHRMKAGGFRAQQLARVAHHWRTERWINLTGTPSSNGLQDLWGQQWFVDAGKRLGLSYTDFLKRWFGRGFDGVMRPFPHAQGEIQERLADCTFSVRASDWFDLEAPIVNDITVDLPKQAMKLYRDMERKMYLELEGQGFEAFNAGAKTVKCLQIANGALYENNQTGVWAQIHDAKLEALDDLLSEISGNVLIAYNFEHDLERLKTKFKRGQLISGDRSIDSWNEGKIELGFAHPASMGHGVEGMQHGGNTLVFFGHDWSLENYLQIIERIGPVRQLQAGYERPVQIHHIYAADTIDEIVRERRETKRSVQDLLREAFNRRRG